MGVQVVQELSYSFFSIFGGFRLLLCDAAKCDKGSEVDCSCIIHDGANDLLDAFDAIGGRIGSES